MPLYEYRCNDCGNRFTSLSGVVSIVEDPQCPECGSIVLTRLISHFSTFRSENDAYDGSLGADSMNDSLGALREDLGDEFSQDIEHLMEENGYAADYGY